MNVVVVEFPAKAKTINKYLGSGYNVLASFGHIRDLPPKDGSVKPDDDFAMTWEVDAQAQKRHQGHRRCRQGRRQADPRHRPRPRGRGDLLACAGSAQAADRRWARRKVERVVFNAVTKSAVLDAIAHPREINEELVDAYLARRALDYLVGLHAFAGAVAQAAGRALGGPRAVGGAAPGRASARSRSRRSSRRNTGRVDADLRARRRDISPRGSPISTARSSTSFRSATKPRRNARRRGDQGAAVSRSAASRSKPVKRHPAPPFITSTLQQEASRKLGFAAKRTMQIAQQLYEGVDIGGETVGLITYMRTDGVHDGAAKPSPKRAR